jgi:hypothetical protein
MWIDGNLIPIRLPVRAVSEILLRFLSPCGPNTDEWS